MREIPTLQRCAICARHVCNSRSSKDGKGGGEATRQGGRILDINQTGLQLKKGGIEETSETASNMEFCLSIAQIGPLIPLVGQSMRQMALDFIERQLLSSCLLPSVGSSFLSFRHKYNRGAERDLFFPQVQRCPCCPPPPPTPLHPHPHGSPPPSFPE